MCIRILAITFFFSLGFATAVFLHEFQTESVVHNPKEETQDTIQNYDTYFASNPSFDALTTFFTNLAAEKGAVFVLSLLINSTLPPAIDTHLMGHFVASELYKQQGLEGLEHCTSDLGFACSHAIVIAALFERGLEIFDDINQICERSKGPGAYSMCFHGFGHGVLAYTKYELPDAIKLCQRVGTEKFNNYEISECVGGVIMEMRGGIHDPELWALNGKKYLDEKNPITMCTAQYMPKEQKYICFLYITPFLFDSIGSQDLPSPEEYEAAINRCQEIDNSEYRYPCYGGFAKEFVSFVYGRDVRNIAHATDEELTQMAQSCYLAHNEEGVRSCLEHTVYALTRTGMYDYPLAGRYCSIVDGKYTELCFTKLVDVVLNYTTDTQSKDTFCEYVTEVYKPVCSNQ